MSIKDILSAIKKPAEDVVINHLKNLEDLSVEGAVDYEKYVVKKKREGLTAKEAREEYESTPEYKQAAKIATKKQYWQNVLNSISGPEKQ